MCVLGARSAIATMSSPRSVAIAPEASSCWIVSIAMAQACDDGSNAGRVRRAGTEVVRAHREGDEGRAAVHLRQPGVAATSAIVSPEHEACRSRFVRGSASSSNGYAAVLRRHASERHSGALAGGVESPRAT